MGRKRIEALGSRRKFELKRCLNQTHRGIALLASLKTATFQRAAPEAEPIRPQSVAWPKPFGRKKNQGASCSPDCSCSKQLRLAAGKHQTVEYPLYSECCDSANTFSRFACGDLDRSHQRETTRFWTCFMARLPTVTCL